MIPKNITFFVLFKHFTKGDAHLNLHTTLIEKTIVKYDEQGWSYNERYAKNKIYTAVNPKNKNVATIRKYSIKNVSNTKIEEID